MTIATLDHLTKRYVLENWEMDKETQTYWMETKSNGIVAYLRNENTFYFNHGTDKQTKVTFKQVKEIPFHDVIRF